MGRAKGSQHAVAAPVRRGVTLGAAPIDVAEAEDTRSPMAIQYGLDPDNLTDEVTKRPTPHMDNGQIIIPRSQKEVDAVIARWRELGPQPIAHDLECAASPTVPNGSGLHPHLGTIRLAQFGVADGGRGRPEALVIDCWKHTPDGLFDLLESPDWPTIIHYAQMETRWLGYRYGLRLQNMIDTRLAAKLAYEHAREAELWRPQIIEDKERALENKGPSFSLGVTCKRELGTELDKTQQNSFWNARKLSPEQERYAGLDVLSLLDLWPQLQPRLFGDDRLEMARHARYLANRWSGRLPEDPEEIDPDIPLTEFRGSERDRALRIVRACTTTAELRHAGELLPYLRVPHTEREDIAREVELQKRRIREKRAKKPIRVQVAGWRKPY